MSQESTVDLLVVGGGPAGLACALHAAQRGLETVVIDKRHPPLDKACGEGLMPDGLAALERMGIHRDSVEGRPFRGIRFVDGDTIAEGAFPEGPGRGIRRLSLHAALVGAAEREGVQLRWDTTLRAIESERIVTNAGTLRARFVVGADGLHSTLARLAGLARATGSAPRRFGLRRHARVEPWSEFVEVHFARGVEAYVTPVGEEEVGIALLFAPEDVDTARFENLLARFPSLGARLEGCAWTSAPRGAGPLFRRAASVKRSRGIALVGDAAGYVDAITGEGLSVAFHEAEALAGCLAGGSLAGYARALRRIRRLPDTTTRLMLWIKDRPGMRRRAIGALARDPQLFDRLLAVHGRQMTPRQLGVGRVARLSLRAAGAWR